MSKQKTKLERQKIIREVTLNNIRNSINRLNSILCEHYDEDIFTYNSYLGEFIGYDSERSVLFIPCFTDEDKDTDCLCCVNLNDIGYVIYDLNLISDDEKKLLNKTTDWLMHFDKTLICLIEYLTK